jgi:ubiquitin-conjugating enzyme E2 G2
LKRYNCLHSTHSVGFVVGDLSDNIYIYLKKMSNRMAIKRLLQEFREMSSLPEGIVAGPISPDNLFEWECMLLGPPGTPYDAGCFRAKVTFPQDYPLSPPTMKFTTYVWHPNVFPNGTVCISILHNPGDPLYSTYEHPGEQWSPVQSLEKILLSVLSLFSEPNANSPANVDAAKQWRDDKEGFKRKVDETVRQSLGFV